MIPIKATITRMGFDPVDPKEGEDPKLKGEAGAGGDAKTVASGSAQGAIIGVLTGGMQGAHTEQLPERQFQRLEWR